MPTPSNIQSDVQITGSIQFKGELSFDGQLKDGNIVGDVLVIGASGRVEGDIEARALVIYGSVTGDVMVAEKCELKGSAKLVGALTTNRLVMEEGASLLGQAEITPDLKNRSAQRPAASGGAFPNGDGNPSPARR
jgi:cytoskeletal protein CcmA (bactofilin family)